MLVCLGSIGSAWGCGSSSLYLGLQVGIDLRILVGGGLVDYSHTELPGFAVRSPECLADTYRVVHDLGYDSVPVVALEVIEDTVLARTEVENVTVGHDGHGIH